MISSSGWATNIGNAYLKALMAEHIYNVAGPEFGELEGHMLILYIKCSMVYVPASRLRWHLRFSDCLRGMGFSPSKAEPDIWMQHVDDHYEYIAVYVNDLAIASKDPKAIIDMLTNVHGFKLKGTGPIEYHVGMTFCCNEDRALSISPRKYIDKMVVTFQQLFGTKPSTKVLSPLEEGDHLEIDDSEFLNDDEVQVYQSLIGAMQLLGYLHWPFWHQYCHHDYVRFQGPTSSWTS